MAVTSVLSPNALSDMNVEAELKLRAINKKLQMESTLDDIFESLGEDIVSTGGKEVAVPDAIFLKLEAAPQGARQVTVPLLMALSGAPTIGATTPAGSEAKQNLKYVTFYYEEFSYAVASTSWGTLANDMSVYGVFEQIQPQISKYMKELRGERIREALLETHDSILTDSLLTAHWNKNWFVANTAFGSQPIYDSTLADFTEEIGDVMEAAAATPADATVDLDFLLNLDFYATNVKRIDPIYIGGKKTYVVLLPSTQINLLIKNNDGQLGDIYTSMVRSNSDEMAYSNVVGRVGNLLIVEDQRYPTITKGGSNGSWTLTPKYVKPGNVDERVKTVDGANHWDIGFLLGKAAVCEWIVRDLHFETEEQNYGYNKGTGAFCEAGISLVEYDIDAGSQTDTSRENYGSIVLAMTTPTLSA